MARYFLSLSDGFQYAETCSLGGEFCRAAGAVLIAADLRGVPSHLVTQVHMQNLFISPVL